MLLKYHFIWNGDKDLTDFKNIHEVIWRKQNRTAELSQRRIDTKQIVCEHVELSVAIV